MQKAKHTNPYKIPEIILQVLLITMRGSGKVENKFSIGKLLTMLKII